MQHIFPEGFKWGVSTAAAQIETVDRESELYGLRCMDGSILERTTDHESHQQEDAALTSAIGNASRLNPSWPRLQKSPYGQLESAVVEEYRNYLGMLKDQGIAIMMTMHHFENPNWFVKKGAWQASESAGVFTDYAQQLTAAFGDLVDSWVTINEPNTYVCLGYIIGHLPPKRKFDFLGSYRVIKNMAAAHKNIYDLTKEKHPEKPMGITNCIHVLEPLSAASRAVAALYDRIFLNNSLDPFNEHADFFGLDYYGKIPFDPIPISEVAFPGKLDRLHKKHDEMWEYYPKGIMESIQRYSEKYNIPIIITENGYCGENDKDREEYIKDHLAYVHKAISQGYKVLGYFVWSLLDNHEWNIGWKRFGLCDVDRITKERKIKPSGLLFSEIARNNGF
jgi:beta-glucosidase